LAFRGGDSRTTSPEVRVRASELSRQRSRHPLGDVDGLIVATAIVHDLILVTRNVGDFEDTRVSLINPWNID
jgi:hypothetical protein